MKQPTKGLPLPIILSLLLFSPSLIFPQASPTVALGDCANALTTVAMIDCGTAALKKTRQELDNLDRRIEAALSPEERAEFHKADASWRQYVEDNCSSESILYRGGTLEGVVYIFCKLDLSAERIKRLRVSFQHSLREAAGAKKSAE